MMGKSGSRARMVEVAADLFQLQGVKGTSIDDVLERSGTGKSQFTHYFKNKDGLVHAVLEYLHTIIRNGEAPIHYDLRTWEDLDGWFQNFINFQKSVDCERSCPVGTIGNDLSDEQQLLRQDIRLFMTWCGGQLSKFFAERRAAGELAKESDPEALADLCLCVMQGGMLLAKIKRDVHCFENAAKEALNHIRSLRR
jgi:AcrR family transcriptional regulator